MPIEGANVDITDHLTRWALIAKPGPASPDCGADRRREQRLCTAGKAHVPQGDDPRRKMVGATLCWQCCQLSQDASERLLLAPLAVRLAHARRRCRQRRPAGKPPGIVEPPRKKDEVVNEGGLVTWY